LDAGIRQVGDGARPYRKATEPNPGILAYWFASGFALVLVTCTVQRASEANHGIVPIDPMTGLFCDKTTNNRSLLFRWERRPAIHSGIVRVRRAGLAGDEGDSAHSRCAVLAEK
jgi:hypothetical protein